MGRAKRKKFLCVFIFVSHAPAKSDCRSHHIRERDIYSARWKAEKWYLNSAWASERERERALNRFQKVREGEKKIEHVGQSIKGFIETLGISARTKSVIESTWPGSIYGNVETKNKFGRDSSLKNTSFDNLECAELRGEVKMERERERER